MANLIINNFTLFSSPPSSKEHNTGQHLWKCYLDFSIYPNKQDTNGTVNWKSVNYEIYFPLYFHCTKVVYWNMLLINNRPLVVFFIINFYRMMQSYHLLHQRNYRNLYPPQHTIYCSLLKGWIESDTGRLMLFLPTNSLLDQNNIAPHCTVD